MSKRTHKEPAFVQPNLSSEAIRNGIKKLKKRVEEIGKLVGTRYDGPEKELAESNVENTVLEIFGSESHEYDEYKHFHIWSGGYNLNDEDYERQTKYERGIPSASKIVQGLISRLEEKLEDMEESPKAQAGVAFQGKNFHPICNVAEPQFRDGHHPAAVFEAAKALVNWVKKKSGSSKDGAQLMFDVFHKDKGPVLAFNDLSTQAKIDEQLGLMHMFAGCVLAIRNPRAHETLEDLEDTPEDALEMLSVISFLANKLDRAVKK